MPNPDANLHRLLRAAAVEERDFSRLEYGFETRTLARLREESSTSVFTWAWRLAPFFGALAVAAGLWSRSATASADSLGSLVVEASRNGTNALVVSYFTGEP